MTGSSRGHYAHALLGDETQFHQAQHQVAVHISGGHDHLDHIGPTVGW